MPRRILTPFPNETIQKTQLKLKNMETKEKVLATMKAAGEALNAGKIAELSGLDRKEVDKAMKQLKEEGAIVSPVRCKWAPAE
jgi:biotin operon repressor